MSSAESLSTTHPRTRRELAFATAGVLTIVACWFALYVLPVWRSVFGYCAEHWDFGIYTEAIARFAWNDWNPHLQARGLRIFSDHFDPILLVALPLKLFLSPSHAGLLTEHLLLLASLGPLAWLWWRGALELGAFLALSALVLLGPATVAAVGFPIHPTTWALLPALLLGAAWVMGSSTGVLVGMILLFACKEENVFCGAFIAWGLWRQQKRRPALVAAAVTVAWALFAFVLRPWWWGPGSPYMREILSALLSEPFQTLRSGLDAQSVSRIGTVVAPFLALAAWAAWSKRAPAWALVLATLPLLLSRLVTHKWAFHYGPPLVGLWIAGMLPALVNRKWPIWVSVGTVLLVLTSTEVPVKKALAQWRPSVAATCPRNPERVHALESGLAYLKAHREGAAIVSSTLVAPAVERPDVYCLTSSFQWGPGPYRYVLVEKPPTGYHWPLESPAAQRLIEKYRAQPGTRVVQENETALLLEGNFTPLDSRAE